MDSKELINRALPETWNLKEPIQNTPESSKPSESDEIRQERIESLKRGIPEVLARYGIPPKFRDMQLKGSIPVYVARQGMCITGPVGVGKTMALCLLARDWLIQRAETTAGHMWGDFSRFYWRFIVFPEFIMRVQDAFNNKKGEETAWEMLEEIAKVPALIIDDLGAEKPTEYVRQATYFIINHREMNQLPTFITTNFSMDHLDENLDPRISSRIAGMCEVIRMEGADRRLQKTKKESAE